MLLLAGRLVLGAALVVEGGGGGAGAAVWVGVPLLWWFHQGGG